MTYRNFEILVRIDGVIKFFDGLSALGIAEALTDIRAAYSGDVELIQYKVR